MLIIIVNNNTSSGHFYSAKLHLNFRAQCAYRKMQKIYTYKKKINKIEDTRIPQLSHHGQSSIYKEKAQGNSKNKQEKVAEPVDY